MPLQNPHGVAVALLGGGLDILLVVLKPDFRPLAEGVVHGGEASLLLCFEIGFHLFLDFTLGAAVKTFVLAFAVGLETVHDGTLPKAGFTLANGAFAVGSFLCHFTPFR